MQPIIRRDLRRAMHDGVGVAGQPALGPPVELADVARRIEIHLGQEPGLEVPERPLDLAFAGGVAGQADLQRDAVVAGELQRRR